MAAAWIVLRQHRDKVLAAARPWAYLMSSAQKHVFGEVRAQQLLTNTASVRGRAREVLPRAVRQIGATVTDLALAFRHESGGQDSNPGSAQHVLCQVGQNEPPLLLERGVSQRLRSLRERDPWFVAFIDLLVGHGADETVTVAVVDRLADLFAVTGAGRWEWAARRDPALAQLGLSPDQRGALVALLAGSRRYRHSGRHDSLLGTFHRATRRGMDVEISELQRRRLAVYVGHDNWCPEGLCGE